MLYNKDFHNIKKENFIFEAEPYNKDINVRRIAAIQDHYEKYGYLPSGAISDFLNWITYRTRTNVTDPVESPIYSSLVGKSMIAQAFNDELLEKMNFVKKSFNVGDVLGKERIHSLECVQIPSLEEGKIVKKLFILDPTFRQFCLVEENRIEKFYEEPRWVGEISTPHPGYFLNLTDKGRTFANSLISFGYFEVTEENLKIYFDAFTLSFIPKDAYKNSNHIGKVSETMATGMDYWNRMINCNEEPLSIVGMDLSTPKEIVNSENKKMVNKIKDMISVLRSENIENYEMEDNCL